MFLGITTLLIAILISGVAAYYSILGLTAIFAAATIPVIIMGASLEAGKVITAVWLHKNWQRASMVYKLYLIPAILFLMLLTSMGVFGFLSKAHIEQGVPAGDVQAQVNLIDEKIAIQRENIELARKTLNQLNATVDETLKRSSNERGAVNADWIRKTQNKERTNLQNEIAAAQKTITKLQEERAPLAAQARKIDAEVGPIKYVAALIYDNQTDIDLLEKAVRWVILLIVIVFDPLAIVLIIAALKQFQWSVEEKKNKTTAADSKSDADTKTLEPEQNLILTGLDGNSFYVPPTWQQVSEPLPSQDSEKSTVDVEKNPEQAQVESEVTEIRNSQNLDTQTQQFSIVESEEQSSKILELETALASLYEDYQKLESERNTILDTNQTLEQILTNFQNQTYDKDSVASQNADLNAQLVGLQNQLSQISYEKHLLLEQNTTLSANDVLLRSRLEALEQQLLEYFQQNNKTENTDSVQNSEQDSIQESAIIVSEPHTVETETQTFTENENSEEVKVQPITKTDFGLSFPAAPERGDMCMRIDFKPQRLFKWNGVKWIEINRESTDAFSYNQEYIKYLASKLASGEYGLEDINETELVQIQNLSSTNNF